MRTKLEREALDYLGKARSNLMFVCQCCQARYEEETDFKHDLFYSIQHILKETEWMIDFYEDYDESCKEAFNDETV